MELCDATPTRGGGGVAGAKRPTATAAVTSAADGPPLSPFWLIGGPLGSVTWPTPPAVVLAVVDAVHTHLRTAPSGCDCTAAVPACLLGGGAAASAPRTRSVCELLFHILARSCLGPPAAGSGAAAPALRRVASRAVRAARAHAATAARVDAVGASRHVARTVLAVADGLGGGEAAVDATLRGVAPIRNAEHPSYDAARQAGVDALFARAAFLQARRRPLDDTATALAAALSVLVADAAAVDTLLATPVSSLQQRLHALVTPLALRGLMWADLAHDTVAGRRVRQLVLASTTPAADATLLRSLTLSVPAAAAAAATEAPNAAATDGPTHAPSATGDGAAAVGAAYPPHPSSRLLSVGGCLGAAAAVDEADEAGEGAADADRDDLLAVVDVTGGTARTAVARGAALSRLRAVLFAGLVRPALMAARLPPASWAGGGGGVGGPAAAAAGSAPLPWAAAFVSLLAGGGGRRSLASAAAVSAARRRVALPPTRALGAELVGLLPGVLAALGVGLSDRALLSDAPLSAAAREQRAQVYALLATLVRRLRLDDAVDAGALRRTVEAALYAGLFDVDAVLRDAAASRTTATTAPARSLAASTARRRGWATAWDGARAVALAAASAGVTPAAARMLGGPGGASGATAAAAAAAAAAAVAPRPAAEDGGTPPSLMPAVPFPATLMLRACDRVLLPASPQRAIRVLWFNFS
ncbi:hypothetical protein I4F81_012057 [Pyropia yezoensis]|uniref:Uncharacterized protein n=1 Tax=Pyropia yezoensis TaxID=2788 RepID=A0ACC3CID8_PYRYE|nr:hypothetical protein I4F81_012057 [Neopyropia yezoensis]